MEMVYNRLFEFTTAHVASADTLLGLQFGRSHVAYALKNRNTRQLYALGYVQVGHWDATAFDNFTSSISTLLHPQQHVEIAYDLPELSMLPVSGFDEKKLQALHQSMYPFGGPAVFKTETMAEWQLCLGYPVPSPLYRGCEALFAQARVRHAFKLALDTAGQSGAQGKLLVDVGIEQFRVLLLKNNRLQFFQSFPYSSPADVLYYLLSVCEAQLVAPTEVEVVLTGLLEKDSALFRELWQYFTHVECRESVFEAVDFPYPAHFFTTLNDLLLCAS
jgi:Protein of unknown function (DUF3822)